jgi:hypothetical protein
VRVKAIRTDSVELMIISPVRFWPGQTGGIRMERTKKNLSSNRFILRPSHAMDVTPDHYHNRFISSAGYGHGHRGFHSGYSGHVPVRQLRRKG